MAVPLGYLDPLNTPQHLQFVVKIIENYEPGVFFHNLFQGVQTAFIAIGYLPHHIIQLATHANRSLFERIPPVPHRFLHQVLVVLYGNDVCMTPSVTLEWHLHENPVSKSNEFPNLDIPVNGRKFCIRLVNDMHRFEFRAVLIEPMGNEDGYIIKPAISWRCREKDPCIAFGNPKKTFDPSP